MGYQDRWVDMQYLLSRPGNLVGPGFQANADLMEEVMGYCRILVVGAGGLGCELLKDLALSGFINIDVIDMDTIELSNLNRQFLFQPEDVGKPKATVAAGKVNQRVEGANVTPHVGRIEDKDLSFYRNFHVIVLGLDSLEARQYMNALVCSMLEFDDDGAVKQSTMLPIVDGGSEGLKGHVRVIYPGLTPCFECTLWLFPPQTKFPLCTLAETPRSAAHCIEYAHLIQWPAERPNDEFDADDPTHMQWVYEQALRRAELHGIPGVTYRHTQGVVKSIIPAVASTNAIVAAACTLEVVKIVSNCSSGSKNSIMYTGGERVYSHDVAYERDPNCPVCGRVVAIDLPRACTLEQAMQRLTANPRLKELGITEPSISMGSKNLYMRGALEGMYKEKLGQRMAELMGSDGGTLTVNDKKAPAPVRVKVRLADVA
ncbi:unnamed protein product [Pedinophyceae sp. YPF-701]|nr:unnamed protein product [Pedinophyceae sp. YPF-701]